MESRENLQSIDTNIILRLILGDVPAQYKKAVNLVTNGGNYYVDDYILGEYEHVMSRNGYPRAEIISRILVLLDNSCFVWNKETFLPVFDSYLAHPKLSFNDCYLAEKAKQLECEPLWTFDKKIIAQLDAKAPA